MDKRTLFIRLNEPKNRVFYNREGSWKKVVVIYENDSCFKPWQAGKKFEFDSPGTYILKADIPYWLLLDPVVTINDEEYWKKKFEEFIRAHTHIFMPSMTFPFADNDIHDKDKFTESIKTEKSYTLNAWSEEAREMYLDNKMIGFNPGGYSIKWNNEIPVHWGKAWENNEEIANKFTIYLDSGENRLGRIWESSDITTGKDRYIYYCGFNVRFYWNINVTKINKLSLDKFAYLRIPVVILPKGKMLIMAKKIDTLVDPEYTIRGLYRGEECDEGSVEFGERNWYWTRSDIFQDNKCELRVSGSGEKTLMVFYPTNVNEEIMTDLYGKLDKDVYNLDMDLLPIPDINPIEIKNDLVNEIKTAGNKTMVEGEWRKHGYDIVKWCDENGIKWSEVN